MFVVRGLSFACGHTKLVCFFKELYVSIVLYYSQSVHVFNNVIIRSSMHGIYWTCMRNVLVIVMF